MGSACSGRSGAMFVPYGGTNDKKQKKSDSNGSPSTTKVSVKPLKLDSVTDTPSKPMKISAAKVAPASSSNVASQSQSGRASSAPNSSRAGSTTSVTSTGSLRSARKGGRKAAGSHLHPGRVMFKTTQMVITRALTLQEHERLQKLKEESEFSMAVQEILD